MNGEPVNSYHGAFKPYNGFVLSYTGSLVGAIEIDGIDPDGMSQKDMEAFSIVIRNLLNILPPVHRSPAILRSLPRSADNIRTPQQPGV